MADAPFVSLQVPAAVAVGFSILIVPLLDTLRVFSIRILNGRSPFTPDRNHVHHLLLDRGLSHSAVTLTCVGVNVFFILLAWLAKPIGPNYLLLIMLVLAFSGLGMLYYGNTRRRLVVASDADGRVKLKKTRRLSTSLVKETGDISKN